MIKSLDLFFVDLPLSPNIKIIKDYFKDLETHTIDTNNWIKYKYQPKVEFKIFYSKESLYINYNVLENSIKAKYNNINDPVYKDSCVEFFVSNGKGEYCNFEFNCIGTKYAGHGSSRQDSKPMDIQLVETINTYPSLGTKTFEEKLGEFRWSLIVEIPLTLFYSDKIENIKSINMECNLYKCGDGLTSPHYLSWNPIKTKQPDFHRPEYFGNMKFK